VAGLIGLCLVAAPRARVRVFFHAVVTAGWIDLPAAWLFSVWVAYQAVEALYFAMGVPGDVAYWGHLGGVTLGLAAGAALRATGRAPSRAEGEAGLRRAVAPESEEKAKGAFAGTAGTRSARRARRREAGALAFLPHALTGVAFGVSLVAAALSFSSGSLLGTLAGFQRAWNTGELEAVAEFLPQGTRRIEAARLARAMGRVDPDAAEGRTTYSVKLLGAYRRRDECRATYAAAPPGTDLYRENPGGRVFVRFLRRRGEWRVHGIDLRGISRP
jgi:hypothetical protein